MKFTSSKYVSNEIINICFIVNKNTNLEFYKQIIDWSKVYLNINIDFLNEEDIKDEEKIMNKNYNFYFVDYIDSYYDTFAWNFYSKRYEINNKFKLVFILKKYSNEDFVLFKNGADDIIYNNDNFVDMKWKFFSLLRRFWNFSHKNTALIHKGVIIDLLKRCVIHNNKEISITKKEFKLLEILVEEFHKKNSFVSKNRIYKYIYNDSQIDNTRLVDQLIFRLKSKFDPNFFEIVSKKGIRIKQ